MQGYIRISAGYFINHLPNTKYGHFRPPLIVGTILCSINFLLLWVGPLFSPVFKLGIAYITYLLLGVLFPVMDISLNSLLPVMTTDMDERNTLSTIKGVIYMVGMMALNIAAPIVINDTSKAEGYLIVVVVVFLIVLICSIVGTMGIKERVQPQEDKKYSIKDMVMVMGQKPVYIMFLASLLMTVGMYVSNTVNTYFFTYIIGNFSLFGIASATSMIALFPAMLLSGKLVFRSDWKNRVKQKKEQLQHEQENIAKVTEILNRMKYNREIENYFSKNQEVAQKVKKIEKEKEEREKEVEYAVLEYQKSRDRIEENLKEFFDNFQINDIYEKLEPHETLKKLTCEFGFNENDKPELTFKVVGKDKKQYAPEWYFSTAQLNVVAFSVFLGKALQTTGAPIQSIFIDDPVGHFDEMNVVCFVDLLRNIVENTGRQLIISTHEETVFGLIQRKLPIGEYPVCYIDFRNAF